MITHFVGIDLGTINDYTAVSVVERYVHRVQPNWQLPPRTEGIEYRLHHLERHLGEPYTEIIARVEELMSRPELAHSRIIVDATGVGRPVVDLLKEKGLRRLVPVTITGGDAVTDDYVNGLHEYRVPKRDLVGTLQVILQNRELKIPSALELKSELITEMQTFKIKLNAETGHDSYEHWRSGEHDDLVLAVALACWYPVYVMKNTTFAMGFS